MSDLQAELAALRQEYLAELPQIAQRIRAALASSSEQDSIAQLRNEVHKLAGNAAAFEQMDIARLAAELDADFDRMEQAQSLTIDSHIASLQRLMDLLDQAAI